LQIRYDILVITVQFIVITCSYFDSNEQEMCHLSSIFCWLSLHLVSIIVSSSAHMLQWIKSTTAKLLVYFLSASPVYHLIYIYIYIYIWDSFAKLTYLLCQSLLFLFTVISLLFNQSWSSQIFLIRVLYINKIGVAKHDIKTAVPKINMTR
jgi:hypothetical protein